jgi:O-antigen/teichoic acid export membrane protein
MPSTRDAADPRLTSIGPVAVPVSDERGWERGASTRFAGLAAARAISQVLSIVWFLYAARRMSESQFGVLATSLVFFAVFAGIADVGTTRSVVRYVAADPRTLRSAFASALWYRCGGGLLATAAITAIVHFISTNVSTAAVALAGTCAAASGVTELAFAGLRAIGRVNTEVVLLIVERVLFLGVAVVVIERGGGAIAVLILYIASNLLSAVIGAAAVRGANISERRSLPRFMDREAMLTAAAFAVLIVTPRISAILVALLTTSREVAVFSVGLRPAEALGLFALSVATPLLAIVRSDLSRGGSAPAAAAVGSITGIIMVGVAPFVVWMVAAPQTLLGTLFGEGRFDGAEPVARLVAVAALGLTVRGLSEALLLAQERASEFLLMVGLGAIVNIVIGLPLTAEHGATGAAVAMLVSELLMFGLVLVRVPVIRAAITDHLAPFVLVGLVVVAGALIDAKSRLVMGAALAAACGVAAVLVAPMFRRLERRHA